MNINYLDFEQPIADLLAHIEELKRLSNTVGADVDMSKELAQLALLLLVCMADISVIPSSDASLYFRLRSAHLY